jgi:hypothetical protein
LDRSRKIIKKIYKKIFIINLNIFTFKCNKSKIEAALEEEEEEAASRRRDHEANQGVHMYHSFVISSSLPIDKVLHNQQ